MLKRPRRLRQNQAIREITQEYKLTVSNLIYPVFVLEGENKQEEIKSMPGIYRYSLDLLLKEIEQAVLLGIKHIALFPVINSDKKSFDAQEAYNPSGLVPRVIYKIKQEFLGINIITDVALDPYTSHGHDGIIDSAGCILNDTTVGILAKMAVCHAEAGADIVAPSDMMDGRVLAIRESLESNNYFNTLILAYTAKYASSFYSPFRDALASHPSAGQFNTDKKTYQMSFNNSKEALREAQLDIQEGADIIMVKPALGYGDIISQLTQVSDVPVFAYNVSGEYSMVKTAAQHNYIDEKQVVLELLTGLIRAGSKGILTYHAVDCAKWLQEI